MLADSVTRHASKSAVREKVAIRNYGGSVNELEACQASAGEEVESPLNGGYGWVCAAAAAVINMHSWGFSSAYSVFLAHYIKNQSFPEATTLEYAFVGSISLTCLFLISPIATMSVSMYGIKPTMLAGMFLEASSLLCASFASKVWHLFLTQGVLLGFGLGLLFIPTAAVVPQWFTTKRSLASGISLAGAAFGGTVYSLAAGAMIENMNLHWALRILAILAFVVNTSMIFLIRDHSKPVRAIRPPFKCELFRSGGLWSLLGFGFFTMLGYFILIFTLANFANHLGLTSAQAATVSAIFNLGQTVGRPFVGYLSDNFGRINMATSMTLIAGALPLLMWSNTHSYAILIAFAMMEGIVGGTFWAAIVPLMSGAVGTADLAFGLTPMWLSLALPCTFSEAIALSFVKDSNSYLGTQLFTGLTYIAAVGCLMFFRGWKINELELTRETIADASFRIDASL